MVTKVQRVRVKTYFTAICYNLMRSKLLDRTAYAVEFFIKTEGKLNEMRVFPMY
jgi:hypothetical protein